MGKTGKPVYLYCCWLIQSLAATWRQKSKPIKFCHVELHHVNWFTFPRGIGKTGKPVYLLCSWLIQSFAATWHQKSKPIKLCHVGLHHVNWFTFSRGFGKTGKLVYLKFCFNKSKCATWQSGQLVYLICITLHQLMHATSATVVHCCAMVESPSRRAAPGLLSPYCTPS